MNKNFVYFFSIIFALIVTNGCQAHRQDRDQKDTTPPEITLVGESEIVFDCEKAYRDFHDPGAVAQDDTDGNITDRIKKYAASSISSDGRYAVYTFTYKVRDSAGNKANPVKRVIRVGQSRDFAVLGEYNVTRYPDQNLTDDGYVVYYPTDNITPDMPVVLFLEGGGSGIHIDNYSGIMKYLASYGYFVIGGETGEGYDIRNYVHIFDEALDTAKDAHELSIKKLAVMGHSQGGGQAFYVMKYFQNKGYGEVSLTLSVDGWFAFDMNKSDLRDLKGDVRFLQMNGVEGTGTDPRIKLTIWNLADQTDRRFLTLPKDNHMYIAGDINQTLKKKDLIGTIGAIVDDSFSRSNTGYCSLPDERKSSYEKIEKNLKDKSEYHSGDCAGEQYNAKNELQDYDIDYCEYESN